MTALRYRPRCWVWNKQDLFVGRDTVNDFRALPLVTIQRRKLFTAAVVLIYATVWKSCP